MNNIPISTQWTLNASRNIDHVVINSVFMIYCHKTSSKGTGFLLNNGYIITNEHVVRDCNYSEIFAISPCGEQVEFARVVIDRRRDLAILKPRKSIENGLSLNVTENITIGEQVITWGYPLAYNGPAPLLSVGHLAGFQEYAEGGQVKKHLIVNGAFNPGNSGGPLLKSNGNEIIGVVVSKWAPFTAFHLSALSALASNGSGVNFEATNEKGEKINFSESQLVADLLTHFRSLTQIMIGEAISVIELKNFLREHALSWST